MSELPVLAGLHILIVEDDLAVARSLQRGLTEEGYKAAVAATIAEAQSILQDRPNAPPALLILDLSLPDGDGIQLLRSLRAAGDHIPVIILTARDSVNQRVTGLDEGADDFLAKPFSFPELLARVRARLRNARQETEASNLQIGNLDINRIARVVQRGGRRVELTAKEFDLLTYLACNAGFPVSRDMLTRDVWQSFQRTTSMDKIIDVHISHLREKIEAHEEPRLIHTLRGVGFILAENAP